MIAIIAVLFSGKLPRGAIGNLGADPFKTFELFLGLWAVRFLILTLAVSPLREIFGVEPHTLPPHARPILLLLCPVSFHRLPGA